MKIKTREQYFGYLQRLEELMRDDLSTDEDLEFDELVRLISLYEKGLRMKKGMTHEEHLDLAKSLLLIDKLLDNARDIIGRSYGYSARESNATDTLRKKLEHLRSMLDTRYHKVTTDEQFLKKGHVYFGERPKTGEE